MGQTIVDFANIVEDINGALELQNRDSFEHKRKIFNELEKQIQTA